MSITQTALKERDLSLEDMVSPDLETGCRAYYCAQAINRLEQLQLEHPSAYQKFPEFETLLQRFQSDQSLNTPEQTLDFLQDITAFRNAASRFLINYYKNSTCKQFELSEDEYHAVGQAAIAVNQHLQYLFAREYAEKARFELDDLAVHITTILQLNAIREEAVSRNRCHGLGIRLHVVGADKKVTFDDATIEDILCDEVNQGVPVSGAKLHDGTLEVSVDSDALKVRPFQGPFYEMAMLVQSARRYDSTAQNDDRVS